MEQPPERNGAASCASSVPTGGRAVKGICGESLPRNECSEVLGLECFRRRHGSLLDRWDHA